MSPAAQKFAHDMLDGMTIIDAAKRLDREITAAVAAEREDCAKLADQEFEHPAKGSVIRQDAWADAADHIRVAIRARTGAS
jgi:hypothetical protein